MASPSPSPRSPEVTEKSKKYDRQLRLWGDHGQSRLEKSHVCLINANATGTEILKSLVLPGVGSFTVVDGNKVSQEDIGNNFFLDADCLGKSRAECATRFLLELNPDVNGGAVEEQPDAILKQNPTFFNRFSVVVGSQLSEQVLNALSQTLWENKVPFMFVQSIGFIGWIRLQINEHTIVESHPDNTKEDLRLDAPFPELVAYMDEIVIEDRTTALKTPWLVLLYKALISYLTRNGANQNENRMDTVECHPCHMGSKQKQAFKGFLKQYLRELDLQDNDEEFEEVMKSVNTALTPTTIGHEVKSILNDPKATKPENSKFWVICGALKEFVDSNNNQLPVRGVLPDMIADSEKYISLQTIYREKAAKDAEDVLGRSQQLLKQAELQGQDLSVLEEDVKLFCKESNNLKVIRGYPIYEELKSTPAAILQELAQNTEDCDQGMMFYLLLRGVLRFENDYKTYPGLLDHDVEPDINRFKGMMTKLLSEWNTTITAKEDFIHELCRYGASELPSIAAFMGGCAAQEIIKIITRQYVPLDNTFIYNALQSTTSSFKIISTI